MPTPTYTILTPDTEKAPQYRDMALGLQKLYRFGNAQEAELFLQRTMKLLQEPAFSFDVPTVLLYHKFLFDGMASTAGAAKTGPLQEVIQEERGKNYVGLSPEKQVEQISGFTVRLWRACPFPQGRSITTAVFVEKYLSSIGFEPDNRLFKEGAVSFRDFLVKASGADDQAGGGVDDRDLKAFFSRWLFGKFD